jgi:hypothetical protein
MQFGKEKFLEGSGEQVMQNPPTLKVVGGFQGRIETIRSGWSERERAKRAAKAEARISRLAAILGIDDSEPTILAVGAPCCEDLVRMAR